MPVRILLVENDRAAADFILAGLERAGMKEQVTVLAAGGDALDFVLARRAHADRETALLPRVILIDMGLPKHGALGLLRGLRLAPLSRDVPVVMFTSTHDPVDRHDAYTSGAHSYVERPAANGALGDTVASVARYWLLLHPPTLVPGETVEV